MSADRRIGVVLAEFFLLLLLGFTILVPPSSLLDYRVARLLAAIAVGALLSTSTCLLQAATANVLAEPWLLGVSSGAFLATALAFLVYPPSVFWRYAASLVAGAGGLLGFALTMLVYRWSGGGPTALILSGVAVAMALSGAAELTAYAVYATRGFPAYMMLFGTYAYVGWSDVAFLGAACAAATLITARLAWKLNLLQFGDEYCIQHGVEPGKLRVAAAVAAALAASITVAIVGIVALLGLVAVDAARELVGSDYRVLVPVSLALGALISGYADFTARLIASYTPLGEVPVGVLSSLVGGAYLALALRRASRGA